MPEPSDSSVKASSVANWDQVFRDVNEWRGACIHHFTSVEQAVTETLLDLHAAKPAAGAVRLRHLIGQRFEDLACAIGADGPFADAGKQASQSLTDFRDRHEAFRTLLCHSQLAVSVDIHGRWLVVAENLSIRGHRAERTTAVIKQADAASRLSDLKRDGQKLSALLGLVRKAVNSS
jgi:hypothetical protein